MKNQKESDVKGYFDVSLTAEEVEDISYIYDKILDIWASENGQSRTSCPRTFAQKVLVSVVDDIPNLNHVTMGWYKYGKICMAPPGDFNLGPSRDPRPQLDGKIKETAERYDPTKNRDYWKRKQYDEKSNSFYNIANDISDEIMKDHKDIYPLIQMLSDFEHEMPEDIARKDRVSAYIREFREVSEQLLVERPNDQEIREELKSAYEDLWDFVASCSLISSAEGNKATEYKQILRNKLDNDVAELKNSLKNLRSEIESIKKTKDRKDSRDEDKIKQDYEDYAEERKEITEEWRETSKEADEEL